MTFIFRHTLCNTNNKPNNNALLLVCSPVVELSGILPVPMFAQYLNTSSHRAAASAERLSQSTPKTKVDWKTWEAEALVSAGLEHQLVNVYWPNSGERLQTFIYGFDLQRSELLLDGVYPWPRELSTIRAEHLQEQTCWLQLRLNNRYFNIEVRLKEIDHHPQGAYLTVSVIKTHLTENRRWDNRAYFETRKGPEIRFSVAGEPLIRGHLANLSRNGAQIEVYGKNLNGLLTQHQKLDGRYLFNDLFELSLSARVKQCKFLRAPCCHSIIRLQFQGVSRAASDKLESYISSVADANEMLVA